MADKRADQHPNKNQQDRGPDKSHRFINEKIVRQPMSRRQIKLLANLINADFRKPSLASAFLFL